MDDFGTATSVLVPPAMADIPYPGDATIRLLPLEVAADPDLPMSKLLPIELAVDCAVLAEIAVNVLPAMIEALWPDSIYPVTLEDDVAVPWTEDTGAPTALTVLLPTEDAEANICCVSPTSVECDTIMDLPYIHYLF